MTGNFLTLLAALGILATAATLWRFMFNRPFMERVRIESTLRRVRRLDDPDHLNT